jgi:integrase
MARTINRLSPTFIKTAKPGMHADGGGLWLQCSVGKDDRVRRSWIFRYAGAGRRERKMGLGSINTVGLGLAREKAAECRRLRLQGVDPIEQRDATERANAAASAKTITFQKAAELYIAAHQSGWRNIKHASQWRNTLTTYCHPVFGKVPVRDVDTGLVMQVLQPIWATKPETAGRVRGRIETILDWAKVSGYRNGENPARWRGHLDHLLPPRSKVRKVQHHPALPHDQVGAFMTALRLQSGVAAKALEFLVLTAARSGEVRGARWDDHEIDLSKKVWVVPASRMKGNREHRVPLSPAAVAVLKHMQELRQNDWVFPGDRPDRPVSDMAMTVLLRRMSDAAESAGGSRWVDPKQGADAVPHGFRSTFRDWVSEKTSYASELAEAALAHSKGDKVEAAYQRGDFFEKRCRLMDAWAIACASSARAADVVPIRVAKA